MAVFRTSTSQLHCNNFLDAHCENPFPIPRYFLHCSDTPAGMLTVIAVKFLQHSVSALKYISAKHRSALIGIMDSKYCAKTLELLMVQSDKSI